jgi:hypothetical protein
MNGHVDALWKTTILALRGYAMSKTALARNGNVL